MIKINKIISLCLMTLLPLPYISSIEKVDKNNENTAVQSQINCKENKNVQVKDTKDDNIDDSTKAGNKNVSTNKFKKLLLFLAGTVVFSAVAYELTSWYTGKRIENFPDLIIEHLSLSDLPEKSNFNADETNAWNTRWQKVDKNSLKVVIRKMLDFYIEKFTDTTDEVYDLQGFYMSKRLRNANAAANKIERSIKWVLTLPYGDFDNSFPSVDDTVTYNFGVLGSNLLIDVEHKNDKIKFKLKN